MSNISHKKNNWIKIFSVALFSPVWFGWGCQMWRRTRTCKETTVQVNSGLHVIHIYTFPRISPCKREIIQKKFPRQWGHHSHLLWWRIRVIRTLVGTSKPSCWMNSWIDYIWSNIIMIIYYYFGVFSQSTLSSILVRCSRVFWDSESQSYINDYSLFFKCSNKIVNIVRHVQPSDNKSWVSVKTPLAVEFAVTAILLQHSCQPIISQLRK